jgi:hypothetical protein
MLATLAALQLLLAAPVPIVPGDLSPQEGKLPDEPTQPETNPPLPSKPGAQQPPPQGGSQGTPATPPAAPAQPPAENLPAPRTIKVGPQQVSLLSGESLSGGSAMMAQAGWSILQFQYAQGLTLEDDLGAMLELDWAKTELRLGAFWRRPLGPAGPFTMGGRLGLSYYNAFGGTWVSGGNHKDRGFEIAPSLALSQHAGSGILSIIGEAPVTVTLKQSGGILFSPRLSLAYEAPLYDQYTLGARIGLGYRAGAGDAPLSDGRAELMFLLVGGYRAF